LRLIADARAAAGIDVTEERALIAELEKRGPKAATVQGL